MLLLLFAFLLRIYQLDNQSLRGDEAATVLYSALPVTELWELSRVTDPHPPLYYLMLHPWQWLVGENGWAMRYAGGIASTLAVAVLYILVRQTLHSSTLSLLSAALLAINPLQIWLAQDIRSYPFFTLLGLLSSWALWSALHTPDRSQDSTSHLPQPSASIPWLLYVLSTVLCLYVHYYTVFLIAFQGLFVLLNYQRFWPKKWLWLTSQIAIGLLIIPGLQLAYNFIGQAAGGIDELSMSKILNLASTALLTGFTINNSWVSWLSLLAVPLWITGIIALLRRNVTSGSLWVLFFAVPVLGVIALSIGRPFFKERFLIQAQPAFELLLAAGMLTLWQLSKRTLGRVAAAACLAALFYTNILTLNNYFTDPAYAKAPPWHLYHNYVNQKNNPGDVMLTNFPEAAVSYYSPNGLPFYVVPAERDRSRHFRVEQTKQIAGAYQRIWFLPLLRQGFDEQGDVLMWLDRHADRISQVFFPVYHLNLYLSPAAIDKVLIAQPITFAHGIQLRGYQILNEQGQSRLISTGPTPLLTLKADDEFTLSLYWQADGPTEVPYTVFTHLIAADGFNRAGYDNQPDWNSYPTNSWLPGDKVTDKYTLTVPAGTPSGDHRLRIGWYQSDTQERVAVLDQAGMPTSDQIVLDVIIRVDEP